MIVTVTLKNGQEANYKDVEYSFQGDLLVLQNSRGVETYPRENVLRVGQVQEPQTTQKAPVEVETKKKKS